MHAELIGRGGAGVQYDVQGGGTIAKPSFQGMTSVWARMASIPGYTTMGAP